MTTLKSSQLLDRMDANRQEIARLAGKANASNDPTVQGLIASLQAFIVLDATRLSEISSKRIIRLTWAIVALTAALLAYTVFLYEDTHTLIKREQFQQHHETQHP